MSKGMGKMRFYVISIVLFALLCITKAELQGPIVTDKSTTNENSDTEKTTATTTSDTAASTSSSESAPIEKQQFEDVKSNDEEEEQTLHTDPHLVYFIKILRKDKILKEQYAKLLKWIDANSESSGEANGTPEPNYVKLIYEKLMEGIAKPGVDKQRLMSTFEVVNMDHFRQLLEETSRKQRLLREKYAELMQSNKEKTAAETKPNLEEVAAQNLYEHAMEMLAKPTADKRVAYAMIQKAAPNNLNARAKLAWGHLLGHWIDLNFQYATTTFENLAAEGIPDANMGLAFLYAIGLAGKNISQPRALIHLTLAALGDDTFAQMALGYRYSFGINVPLSCEKALSYYQKVAKKVASKVTFTNGPIIHRVHLLDEAESSGSQETQIVDYYQLLADRGDVQSQVGLGQLYYQGGKAIPQDHQKALEYFTQAANAGNAIGFAFLGKLYLEGSDFIKADNDTAFKYFKKAADLGDPVGQSGLGLMYLNGIGVPKDALKALEYFTQAADQGWADGHLNLGNMYFTGNGVKTDYQLALKYFNLASQAGHVLAYYYLGIMHANGLGVLRSCPAAVEFFKTVSERGRWSSQLMSAYSDYKNNRINEAYLQYALLAEMGYEVAQSNAAYLLDIGEVTLFENRHEELIRAFYYWKRSAAQGYSAAQVKLGDYYYYGWGTNVDFETAAALYRKASEQQYNAQAMFNLGYMHEQGLGMKKDWHLAKRLYDLAAETSTDAKVPVALALFKLQLLAKIEAIKESPYKFIFYLDENISANWDLYMITALTLLLGTIVYHRRPYQQQEDGVPAPAAAAAAAAAATAAPPTDGTADSVRPQNSPDSSSPEQQNAISTEVENSQHSDEYMPSDNASSNGAAPSRTSDSSSSPSSKNRSADTIHSTTTDTVE